MIRYISAFLFTLILICYAAKSYDSTSQILLVDNTKNCQPSVYYVETKKDQFIVVTTGDHCKSDIKAIKEK